MSSSCRAQQQSACARSEKQGCEGVLGGAGQGGGGGGACMLKEEHVHTKGCLDLGFMLLVWG